MSNIEDQQVVYRIEISGRYFYYHIDSEMHDSQLQHELRFYEKVPLREVPQDAVCSNCGKPVHVSNDCGVVSQK